MPPQTDTLEPYPYQPSIETEKHVRHSQRIDDLQRTNFRQYVNYRQRRRSQRNILLATYTTRTLRERLITPAIFPFLATFEFCTANPNTRASPQLQSHDLRLLQRIHHASGHQ